MRMKTFARSPIFWLLTGFVALLLVNLASNPAFLRITVHDGHLYGPLIDILVKGAPTMLLALGMTLVIATSGVDLSVGSVVAIAAAICAQLLHRGTSLPLALAAAVGVGAVCGTINGVLVARAHIQPIVATLILMVAGRGVAQLICGGQVITVDSAAFKFVANGYVLGLPLAPLIVGGVYLATHFFLRKTAAGLFVEAVGDNETASRFAGLAAGRVKIFAYVFSGVCAGLTGVLVGSDIGAADGNRAGANAELDAIFAAVVGGTALTGGRFSILGSLLGAVLMQTLTTTMLYIGVAPEVAPVPKALVIIGVSLLQSEKLRDGIARVWSRPNAATPS